MQRSRQHKYLLIGSPGVGKSTLLNCIIGFAVFKSGLSYGQGYTEFFQSYSQGNQIYMDTPGLADVKLMQRAAVEIKKALTQSGRYHLFFFVKLRNGRVDKDDLATIDKVLASIGSADVPYSIIINMVKKRQYATLMQGGDEFRRVKASLNTQRFQTKSVLFVPELKELDEEDCKVAKLPPNVITFIHSSPSIDITPAIVRDIRLDEIANAERLKRQQAEMRRRQLEMELLRREQEEFRQRQIAMEQRAKILQREREEQRRRQQEQEAAQRVQRLLEAARWEQERQAKEQQRQRELERIAAAQRARDEECTIL